MPPTTQPIPVLHVIEPYLAPLIVALVVTVIATPIIRLIAVKRKIYDLPDSGLKPHATPIPYLGGVAIYLGWAAAILTMACFAPPTRVGPESRSILWYVFAAGTLMMLIGLADDLWDLKPRTKLLCEFVAAGVLIYGGVGAKCILVFTAAVGIHLPDWTVLALSTGMTVVVLMGAGNATNLIDGLDGLCSGVTGIIAIGFAAIATHLAAHAASPELDPVRMSVAVALLGACIGFLRYNFNPAVVFMGDAGSLLLGFNAAVMLLLFSESAVLRWFLGACMVFSLPVFDTSLAIARRWLNGRPIFRGDRSHFYDQLRDRGLSVRRTVLICYALAAGLAAIGCLVLLVRTRYSAVVFLLAIAAAIVTVVRLGMLRVDDALQRDPRHGKAKPPA